MTLVVPGMAQAHASDDFCIAGASVDVLEPEDTWPFTDCKEPIFKPRPPKKPEKPEEPREPEKPRDERPEQPKEPKERVPVHHPAPRVKPAPAVPGKPTFTG